MKILTVKYPIQNRGDFGQQEDPQYVEYYINEDDELCEYVPSWIIRTDRGRIGESISEWFVRKEQDIITMNKRPDVDVEGIYLYDIKALNQRVCEGMGEDGEMHSSKYQILYYIRCTYINNKKRPQNVKWVKKDENI